MNVALREQFEAFVQQRGPDGTLRVVPTLSAEAMARGFRDALDDKPSNERLRAYAVDDPDDRDAALAIEANGPDTLIGNNPRLPMERIAAHHAHTRHAGARSPSAHG
jgi:hypothetical protein